MPYDPNKHHRRSIRLKGYDYSQEGLYFVTICCQNRIYRFVKIKNGKMILNDWGKIVHDEWQNLINKYPSVCLHEFIIMPNHFHAILQIVGEEEEEESPSGRGLPALSLSSESDIVSTLGRADPAPTSWRADPVSPSGLSTLGRADPAPTLGNIIGYFKYQTTKKIDLPDKLWQRDYYEHIIRNEQAYQNISNYIVRNPEKWEDDKFHF